MQKYSQFKATMAIAGASLKSIFRSPQSVFFSIFFPIVLIVIFGAISNGGAESVSIGIDKNSDTSNIIYQFIQNDSLINIRRQSQDTLEDLMQKGKITALINITKTGSGQGIGKYNINIKSSSASQPEMPVLRLVLGKIISAINSMNNTNQQSVATISAEVVPGREYKLIDFYLPGMIGFSLIGSAVFGVAFLFFNLRETLVLKRLYASPILKRNIILGETISRIIFQVVTVIVLILFGTFFYHFTLANGVETFIDMLIVSILGVMVFMGVGFIISGFSKNQNVIPIYSNLFMFPQYFLSGTFFSSSALPKSLQPFIQALPLTALNDALRKISFEGAHLIDCGKQIGILSLWGIIVYAIAIKVFRWE